MMRPSRLSPKAGFFDSPAPRQAGLQRGVRHKADALAARGGKVPLLFNAPGSPV